jgi:gamma-tubulin complex component 2
MPSRLESLLELALRTSTANADPFKDDLGLELLSYDLTTQMVRILSIQTHEERGNHSASLISFCSPIKIDAVFFFFI